MTVPNDSSNKKKSSTKKNYMKYGSLGYEMAALMLIAVFLGKYLDNYFQNEQRIITAVLVITFMGAFMYKLVRDLSKDQKKS